MSVSNEAVVLAAKLACNRCVRIFEISDIDASQVEAIHQVVAEHHYTSTYDAEKRLVRLLRVQIPDKV